MSSILKIFLDSGNNIVLNRTLVQVFGLEAAAYLEELVAIHNAKGGDEFKVGRKKIEEHIGLSKYKQKKAEDVLIKAGVLSVKKKGIPARNYYKVHYDVIFKLLKVLTSSGQKFLPQVVKNFNHYNNISSHISSDINITLTSNIGKTKKDSPLKEKNKPKSLADELLELVEKQPKRIRYKRKDVDKFINIIKDELGFLPTYKTTQYRNLVHTMLVLLTKTNKRYWLVDDVWKNIEWFWKEFNLVYKEKKYYPKSLYKLYLAVKFFAENYGTLRTEEVNKLQRLWESYQKALKEGNEELAQDILEYNIWTAYEFRPKDYHKEEPKVENMPPIEPPKDTKEADEFLNGLVKSI